MKNIIAVSFLFFCWVIGNTQGYNNLWLMGYGNYAPLPFGGTNIDFYNGQANA
jgi:hypothetical protein